MRWLSRVGWRHIWPPENSFLRGAHSLWAGLAAGTCEFSEIVFPVFGAGHFPIVCRLISWGFGADFCGRLIGGSSCISSRNGFSSNSRWTVSTSSKRDSCNKRIACCNCGVITSCCESLSCCLSSNAMQISRCHNESVQPAGTPCERRGTDGNRQAKINRASLCLTCRDYATCLGMLQEQGRFFSLFFSRRCLLDEKKMRKKTGYRIQLTKKIGTGAHDLFIITEN